MGLGRIVSSCTAGLAVVGVAAIAVAMARGSTPDPNTGAVSTGASGTATTTQAIADEPFVPYQPSSATTSTASTGSDSATPTPSSSPSRTTPASRTLAASTPSVTPAVPTVTATATTAEHTTAPPPPVPQRGIALPLRGTTSGASEVITVVAHSTASTTATLQAWTKAPGGGWLRHGPAILAHVGADGLTTRPSESRSATPIGSFTLTQAFGALSNPHTSLPYFVTTPGDWWISQPGRLYNTHQRCSGNCAFTQGDPNEHLMYETPYYNYAVVIDANTPNAPGGVVQGAGSAFFLHVTDGNPTAGCVAIPQSNLVAIMQWLTLADHPRILVGIA
jgi:L,D-peptidoglycan transpeptidase YkuD (ErfK/YbiS/YcfS/YnhG family)